MTNNFRIGFKSLRVVQVLSVLEPGSGGPSRCVLGLSRAQAARGLTVDLVAGGDSGCDDNVGQNGLTIRSDALMQHRFSIPSFRMGMTLWQAIENADIVHLNGVWNGVITQAGWLGRLCSKPMVLSPHGMLDAHNMDRRRLFKRSYLRLVERGNLNALAGFHFLDETERAGCDWLVPARELPALIQPNGLNLSDLHRRLELISDPARSLVVSELGARHLIFLGRLNVIKGLELQLDVLADARAAGQPVHLHWIGPDDGEWPKLRALARRLGVADVVHWHGPMYGDERLGLLRAADAVLLTSHYECNSVMMAETLAVGGVLLATDTCHVDRPAAAGALRVVPRDRVRLGEALIDLLRHEQAAQALRSRALAYARAALDWKPLVEQMICFYQSLIEKAT